MVQEEEQRELEMKQLESARYEQEIKMAQREAEEEKVRRKQAYQRSACLCQDVQAAPPRSRTCHVILRAFLHSNIPMLQQLCASLLVRDYQGSI